MDLKRGQLAVRQGKGDKDRVVMLPAAASVAVAEQIRGRLTWHQQDRDRSEGRVWLPDALERKYPNAGKMFGWHWLFPQDHLSTDPRSGIVRRHHAYEQTLARAAALRHSKTRT